VIGTSKSNKRKRYMRVANLEAIAGRVRRDVSLNNKNNEIQK
jgi:hypothetical protein